MDGVYGVLDVWEKVPIEGTSRWAHLCPLFVTWLDVPFGEEAGVKFAEGVGSDGCAARP